MALYIVRARQKNDLSSLRKELNLVKYQDLDPSEKHYTMG